MTIRYQCNTAQNKCYAREHMPDWDLLKGCFPSGVRPTDVDGAVELNGHVLFLEWKGQNAPLTTGQARMFLTMTRDAPKQRVLVLFGEKGFPKRVSLFYRGQRRTRDCDINWLRDYCTKWTALTKRQQRAA